MQLLLLQPLVDAKAETSAAVDPRSVPASPAKMTDFKQEGDANGFRVFITFEGNPHYRGIEELVKVSTNGWNETFSEPRDNTTKFKRTFEFVIPEEFKFHQFAIIFGKEVHIFQLEATGFEKNAVYQKYIGLVNYLSEKVKYMMPDYGVGWMSQVVRKELDNIIYTQTNLGDDLRQLKTDVEGIEAKLPDSFDDFVTIVALNQLQTEVTVLIKQSANNLNNRIDTNKNSIAEIKTKIPTLESGAEAAAAEGKKLKEDIQKVKEQLEDGRAEMQSLTKELESLQKSHEKSHRNLAESIEQKRKKFMETTEQLRNKLQSIAAETTVRENALQQREKKVDEKLKNQKESFESELARLNVRVDAAEASRDSSSNAVGDLLLKHEALKGSFENKLDQKAKQLTGKVDAVEDKITKELASKISGLESKIAQMEREQIKCISSWAEITVDWRDWTGRVSTTTWRLKLNSPESLLALRQYFRLV